MRRFDMYVPEDLDDLFDYLDGHKAGIHLIGNGSDLINRIHRRQLNAKILVDLSGFSELNYVKQEGDMIKIGALTTISDIVSSPVIYSRLDVFREVAAKFGAPNITNVATIGGNICAASSSEDLLPVLLVLDAQVRLRSKDGERVIRLEDFLKGKRVTDLKSNEILVETFFADLDENSACSFEKVGMRNSLIIAFVNTAVYLKLNRKAKAVDDVRIAFNRVAGKIPERAKSTEEKLRGRRLDEKAVRDAIGALRNEVRLSSDFRVSGQYRTEVATTLLKRCLNRCAERLIGEKIVV